MVVPKRAGARRDNGYFGPGSMAWEIAGHPATLAGMLNGAYIALLFPEVAQSIQDTSVMRVDPLGRGDETMYYVYTAIFGDTEEARRAGKFVQGRHNRVRGHDPVTDTDFTPTRSDLAIVGHGLTWLSLLASYETYVRRLTDDEREKYWQEGLIAAGLLGLEVSTMPATYRDWCEVYRRDFFPRMNYSVASEHAFANMHTAAFAPPWARPAIRATVAFVNELTLATFDDTERILLRGTRSKTRLAAARLLGRSFFAVAALAPVRDLVEQYINRGDIHALLSEARAIEREQKQADGALRIVA
ncbi:oxygenase MpaB family protein [Nocardia sp. NPDC056100]|uniref:oxygenase MpaB family protein n=1 Tax=Nocardia sp. NPDC056100 TaxID=3345712 RepID=UPI0035D74145